MANIGVCLDPFFLDLPYKERIRKVAELGFKGYEFWFHNFRFSRKGLEPEEKNFDEIAELNARYGLVTTDIVYNHCDGGIFAALINAADRGKLVDNFGRLAELAKKIGCRAFISASGNVISDQCRDASILNMLNNLNALSREAETQGIVLLLEPWNTKVDHPNNFLWDPQLSVEIVKAVDSPNVKLLYDIYHMQIMSGNILDFVRDNLQYIGHFHIAGVPGRHEPFDCELDYTHIIKTIEKSGYQGFFGLEYWATIDDETSLRKSLNYLS
jgi:hydroxypyruvate isomerase